VTVPAIGALSASLPTTGLAGPTAPSSPSSSGASGSTGSDFAAMLEKGLNAVQSAQDTADGLAVQAATGDLTDIHQYTIAATQASLMTELATTLRSKGIDAFNQIMGMQA
jgi:flagellar hook-basal body complex protein FliE